MNVNKRIVASHASAMATIVIWGTTFISTKVLLGASFSPIEILCYRFVIGCVALWLVYPHPLKTTGVRQELLLAGAGLCGVTLYFLLENIALTYSPASNVGVIVSIAPFFTAMFSSWFSRGEKPSAGFFAGFVVAILGIALISFNGSVVLQLNPLGDLLAALAAVVWAIYSVLTKKISAWGYHTVQTTRRIFLYGLLFMVPAVLFSDIRWDFTKLQQPVHLLNIVFLGLGASALCFVTWNYCVKLLGAVRTSVYIYMVPVVTVITSMLVLHEQITWGAWVGIVLTLIGLLLSEGKIHLKRQGASDAQHPSAS